MSKDIRTRNIIKDVKSLDKTLIVGERIKDTSVKTKNQVEESNNKEYNNPSDYAQTKINEKAKHYADKTVIETKVQGQKIVQYAKAKYKIKQKEKTILEQEKQVSSANTVDNEINTIKTAPSVQNSEVKQSALITDSKQKIKTRNVKKNIKSTSPKSSIKMNDTKDIKQPIRFLKKHQTKIPTQKEIALKKHSIQATKKSKESYHAMKNVAIKSSATVKKGVKASAHAIKRLIENARLMYAFITSIGSIAILIILFIAIIGGVFMTGGGSDSQEQSTLSQEVIAYTPIIQKYSEQYEIPHYLNVIQAVMMQESGGKGNDLMQASECSYNKKFPKKPNGITDPEYSIEVGIENLANCIERARCVTPFDIQNLSLALQGYNFGSGYIEWALTNFGGYSQGNAKVFSDEQARKHGWKSYGDPSYVPHVMRYYQFGTIGKGNSELVNVAASQIGNKGGMPYWSWWGYRNRVEWCAIFVSWCAEQCGMIEDGSILKFENVTVGMNWFKERNQWLAHGSIPSEGMIIFFDWDGDNHCDHVGMVEKVDKGIVTTIEGNSNDQVRENTYSVNSNVIMGYGTME